MYKVKNNETIIDVCLNSTGNLSSWDAIIQPFDTWTPKLLNNQEIESPEVINKIVYEDCLLYPKNNFGIFDLDSKISVLVASLEATVLANYTEPTPPTESNELYNAKEGQTIIDSVLNSTGDISNWSLFLNKNNLDTWTPNLKTYKIGYNTKQTNVTSEFNLYPICNNPGIPDLDTKIDNLINNFANVWILKTGFWNDSGLWVDTAYWID